jgi:hypothetical protein
MDLLCKRMWKDVTKQTLQDAEQNSDVSGISAVIADDLRLYHLASDLSRAKAGVADLLAKGNLERVRLVKSRILC